MTRRVVVLGGGLSGLVACYRLLQAAQSGGLPLEVVLVEASGRLGGVLETQRAHGFVMEKGPDCFLASKPAGVALCEELGLAGELIGTNETHRRSFVLRGERLLPVPQGYYLLAPYKVGPFLTTPVFSPLGKLRMAMDLVLPRRKEEGDESLASFVRRRLGREALERLAQPMVAGIYSADPESLSLQATMPQFHEMERAHRSVILGLRKRMRRPGGAPASGARYGLFASLAGGMDALVDALARNIPAASVRLECRAEALARADGGRWRVRLAGGEEIGADAVCLALPPRAARGVLKEAAPDLAEELAAIPSGSLATLNLGFRAEQVAHPLDGMGFVVPAAEGRALLACSFSSTKFAGRAPAGMVLLRAFAGAAAEEEGSDEALEERLLTELRAVLGISGAPRVRAFHRYRASLPHYLVGHAERVARVERALGGLRGIALAGNACRGVGIPDCVDSAGEAAEKILGDLRAAAS